MNRRLTGWLEDVSAQAVGTILAGVILASVAKLAGAQAFQHVRWQPILLTLVGAVLAAVGAIPIFAQGKEAAELRERDAFLREFVDKAVKDAEANQARVDEIMRQDQEPPEEPPEEPPVGGG